MELQIRVKQGDTTREIEGVRGETLFSALIRAGVWLAAPCGGRKSCGKCIVRVNLPKPPAAEELRLLSEKQLGEGYRLACCMALSGEETGLLVEIPQKVRADVLSAGISARDAANPAVSAVRVSANAPTMHDPLADVERMEGALGGGHIWPLNVLQKLPGVLRGQDMRVDVVRYEGRVLDVTEPGSPLYGVAVDIGTTTLAAYLIDLRGGEALEVATALNPQRAYGADVISRAEHAMKGAQPLAELAQRVREGIMELVDTLCGLRGIGRDQIYHVVCVGNPIMQHLVLGLPVGAIAVIPFTPVYAKARTLTAVEAGLSLPGAMLTVAPCIAGYVGGDTLAAALACDLDEYEGTAMLLDIGTNGEIMLGGKQKMLCCSTAAGPALEGAHIRCGTGGVLGAVDHVRIFEDRVEYTTIGGADPIGICGSGLVDAVAQMLAIGIIDESGRFDGDAVPGALAKRMIEIDGQPAFVIARGEADVYLCQRDLREVQLAKGAVAAGIQVLCEEMGIDVKEIDRLYLAGGFGNYMNIESACAIGLLPAQLIERITPVGNAAGVGAQRMLRAQGHAARVEKLRARCKSVELSLNPQFQDLFIDHMMFESV